MDSGSVARRYAKALFGLAVESGRVEAWNDSFASLDEALHESQDLEEILGYPVLGREERHGLAKRLAEALRLEPEPAHLLLLLADRNRLDRLSDVLRAFSELADAHLGRMRAKVTSAVPLSPDALNAIAHRLSEVTRSGVLLERSVEPALLGGVIAQVGSVVYDGSVRTQLADLRRSLKR